ncbi:MAG: hypothetical protein PHQ35_09330 [Phycisphaerae bacterium]|nr:hypothetical protein [Phycisphaerae bacterium]MDD5239918.1 hypothetical protein [Candidatus Nanoarchaeia archaeon]
MVKPEGSDFMFLNKGTFIQGGGGSKNYGTARVSLKPNGSLKQLRELLASQGGDKPSREVSDNEEELMMTRIYNHQLRR